MLKYWVFPITEDNLQICLEHGVIGARAPHGKRLERFEPGDLIVFYVSNKRFDKRESVQEFQAVAKCIGYAFESNDDLWPASEGIIFPIRVRIKVVNRKKCRIRPLIKMLSFIKNKNNWGSAFMSGVRSMSSEDFNIIIQAMK